MGRAERHECLDPPFEEEVYDLILAVGFVHKVFIDQALQRPDHNSRLRYIGSPEYLWPKGALSGATFR